jgi:hypothetical protein
VHWERYGSRPASRTPPTLGYPISINIDPVTSIPGDEVVSKVTSFEALP